MPSVFLCYASEDRSLAEKMQLALAAAGHDVFFDESSLNAGDDYNGRILSAIQRCDAFVFVASQHSVAEGKYTLSELKFIRQRWPSPAGRVLTVNVGGLKPEALPNYLAAATLLTVGGNAAVEVRAALEIMLDRQRSVDGLAAEVAAGTRRRRFYATAAAAFLALATTLGIVAYPRLQLLALGANLRLADANRIWISEGQTLRIADGWNVLVLKADDVKFKNQIVFLSLRTPAAPAQQRQVKLLEPKTIVVEDKEYLLEVHDFADVERAADQAEISVSAKSALGR